MKYPINVEVMRKIYRENLEFEGSEFTENDDEYICALIKVVNEAYFAGVKEGLRQANTCSEH